jgi:hypothetical protein
MQGQSITPVTPVLERGSPGPAAADLVEKLEATRQAMSAFQRTRAVLVTALGVFALAGLFAAADWWLVLPTAIRGLGLLAIAAAALLLLARGLLGPARRLSRRDAATEVESAFPDLGQRVQTTLEYAEPAPDTMPAAPGLVRALATDAGRRTRGLDFHGLVPWRSLAGLGAGLTALVVVSLILLATSADRRTAALRLFLVPVQYTQLQVKPGDQSLKVGADLTVQATLNGRPVKTAEVLYRSPGTGEDWTRLSLAPPEAGGAHKLSGTLQTTLKGCEQDLEYRVVAGPV